MNDNKKGTRSPIKQPPLRQAGQSLDEGMQDVLWDKAALWILVICVVVSQVVLEWYRAWFRVPPDPWLISCLALVVIGIAVWRIVALRKQIRTMRLGRDGERLVGQSLEELRAKGYVVIHDLPGDGFNVDHVLVGPGGVYAVETKTRMKPIGHDAQVVYDGETIKVDGFAPERDPVRQVRAEADFVRGLIESTTGRRMDVRPVVLFPGWYTKFEGPKDIWVLNQNALPGWLNGQRRVLSDEDIHLIAGAISTYVRSKELGKP